MGHLICRRFLMARSNERWLCTAPNCWTLAIKTSVLWEKCGIIRRSSKKDNTEQESKCHSPYSNFLEPASHQMRNFDSWKENGKTYHTLLLIYCSLQQHIVARWKLYLKMELQFFSINEGKIFNDRRIFFFTWRAGNAVFLLCLGNVAVMKEYNIRLHYEKELEGMRKVKSTIWNILWSVSEISLGNKTFTMNRLF